MAFLELIGQGVSSSGIPGLLLTVIPMLRSYLHGCAKLVAVYACFFLLVVVVVVYTSCDLRGYLDEVDYCIDRGDVRDQEVKGYFLTAAEFPSRL